MIIMPGFEVIGEEERKTIEEIFTKGVTHINEFKREFAKKFNVGYAHTVSSGTAALICALNALDVRPGDEVITQCHTFIATVEAIVAVRAIPVIVDINDTLNMDPESFRKAITPRTKVVIPVHMLGVTCEMDEIVEIARDHDIKILEDTAQAIGGRYRGRCTDYQYKYLGTIGDIGIYSFDMGKMLTCGEGGMIVTDDEELYVKARAYSDHGHAYNPNKPRGEDDIISFGLNYRMSIWQAAVGLAQLRKLDDTIKKHVDIKEKVVKRISELVDRYDLTMRHIPQSIGDIGDSVCFTFPFYAFKSRQKFCNCLREEGYSTKNLPDAIKYHYNRCWKHILMRDESSLKSDYLLNYTVALPINLSTNPDDLCDTVESCLREACTYA